MRSVGAAGVCAGSALGVCVGVAVGVTAVEGLAGAVCGEAIGRPGVGEGVWAACWLRRALLSSCCRTVVRSNQSADGKEPQQE